MQKDSIFRIYSMTKPITGVAVLMLMEEGRLSLSDPISEYLPALKNPKVLVETVDAQGRRATSTVPANQKSPFRICCGIRPALPTEPATRPLSKQCGTLGSEYSSGTNKEPLSTRITDQRLVEELGKVPRDVPAGAPVGKMGARSMCCWRLLRRSRASAPTSSSRSGFFSRSA